MQHTVIYPAIEAQRRAQGYTRERMADLMGLSLNALRYKMQGRFPWTWPEIKTAKKILNYQGAIEKMMQEARL